MHTQVEVCLVCLNIFFHLIIHFLCLSSFTQFLLLIYFLGLMTGLSWALDCLGFCVHLPSNTDQFTKQKISRLSGLAGDKLTKPVKNFGYFPDV